MNNSMDVITDRLKNLLSRSSEKELSKRRLGRRKRSVALDELRSGLAGIVEYLEDISDPIKDHTLDKDIVSRLADKSWGSEGLKKQQSSLKRTETEIGKAKQVIDSLSRVVSEQYLENMYTYDDVEKGLITEDEYHAQKSPEIALRARREELNGASKIVRELREAIEWAKDIKKRDEENERLRRRAIELKLKAEISKQVCDLAPLDLVAKMTTLTNMWFDTKSALENLTKYGSKSHLEYLTNHRKQFITELLKDLDYNFTREPIGSLRQPLELNSENVSVEISTKCQGWEQVKDTKDYKEYVELYMSAKAVQSVIKVETE